MAGTPLTEWFGSVAGRLGLGGAFEFGDIELFHLEHGLHGLRMLDEIGQARGYDLPR